MREFIKTKISILSILMLSLLVLSLVFIPVFMDISPSTQSIAESYQSPSTKHWFGTDKFGRDVFVRFLYGGRISILVALCSVLLTLCIGIPYGLLSGYVGGFLDSCLSWIINVFMAFPQFFLILAIVALIGPNSLWWIIVVIGLLSWMDIARLVRNQTLSLKERDFILAEKVLGISRIRILFRHILPNLLAPIIVSATLMVGNVILLESSLSFLGLGVQPPNPSWGNIINEGREVLTNGWWLSIFPGLAIVTTVFCINIIGERLQDIFRVSKS